MDMYPKSKLYPSPELAKIIGSDALLRSTAVRLFWNYIKKNNLQDPRNKRLVNADGLLRPLFGKAQISIFNFSIIITKNLYEKPLHTLTYETVPEVNICIKC